MADPTFSGSDLALRLCDAKSIRFFAGGIFVVAETNDALFDTNFVFSRGHRTRNILSEITFTYYKVRVMETPNLGFYRAKSECGKIMRKILWAIFYRNVHPNIMTRFSPLNL